MGSKDNRGSATPTPSTVPASARPIADKDGVNVELHYSPGHIAQLRAMKRNGARIKLPPGVTLDDDAPKGSTAGPSGGSLSASSGTSAGTAGSGASGA